MNPRNRFVPPAEKTHELGDDFGWPGCEHVLVLEDDAGLAEVLEGFFQENHCSVTVVPTGKEGIERVMDKDFDIILCDMVMPGFPGDMFYRAVERVRPHLCKRFIFMTGNAGDSRIDEFIRGIRGMILWKPFQLLDLDEAVKSVLRKSR